VAPFLMAHSVELPSALITYTVYIVHSSCRYNPQWS